MCLLRMTLLLLLLPATGCSLLPMERDDLYELRREAQLAYAGSEDARAEKLLLGLVRAVPNDAEAWFYLGNLYARSKRPEEAINAYQKTLMLDRRDPRAWHNMGVVRLREAWAAFIQAHEVATPGDPLHAKLEAVIKAMESIPLEGLNRTAPPAPVPDSGKQ